MEHPSGIYPAKRQDGTPYWRASITYKNKHISLGSYSGRKDAVRVYREAGSVLHDPKKHYILPSCLQHSYSSGLLLPFEKWICLVNFRDNGIYIKTPVYLLKKYFLYFLSPEQILKFDADDLFYYSNHRILKRGNYLYVNDYGSQTNILTRYGIQSYALPGRDYTFANGDSLDFRYGNLRLRNRYHGVREITKNGRRLYKATIHIRGNYVVGTYPTEKEAAIAYNKAADLLCQKGSPKKYPANYIEDISSIEYASIYNALRISKKIRQYSF